MADPIQTEETPPENVAADGEISAENLRERHYLWMARAFAVISVVALLANVIMLTALFSLMPIMRVQPFYLSTFDKDQQIITIVRPDNATLSSQVLQESFIRQYLLAYFTIGSDVDELERRWGNDGLIAWMSETGVREEFLNTALPLLEQAKKDGLTRNVRILVVNRYRVEQQGSVIWNAEVELTSMKRNIDVPEKSKWRVHMEVVFRPTRRGLLWSQRLKNPLGFTVLRFGMEPIS